MGLSQGLSKRCFVTKGIKIGILETGMNSPGLAAHGAYTSWFERMLLTTSGRFSYQAYQTYNGEIPSAPDACDAYIISGSSSSVLDADPWIKALSDFLADIPLMQPIVGICFGHQLLHQIFGGKVEKSTKGWGIGVHEYNVALCMDWMNPRFDRVGLLVSHMDQVVQTAPDTTVLAGSDFCPNAITMIGTNILTLQPHPEHTKEFAHELYNTRRARIGNGHVDDAINSLQQPTHEGAVAEWIAQFIAVRV